MTGFDALIGDHRKAPGTRRVMLAQFDNEYSEDYAERDVSGGAIDPGRRRSRRHAASSSEADIRAATGRDNEPVTDLQATIGMR